MSDDNVIEIDFDENEVPETLDTGVVVQTPEEGSEDAGGVDKILKIGVLGTNSIAKSIPIMFSSNPKNIKVTSYDNVDTAAEGAQRIYYICLDAVFDKEDFDDSNIIDACLKLTKNSKATIVLKTTVPYNTIERILIGVNELRFIYSPEEASDDDLREIMRSTYNFVGGATPATEAYTKLLSGASLFERTTVVSSALETSLVKTGIVGLKAITQTFYNQLHDCVIELGGNYTFVKKIVTDIKTKSDLTIPTFMRAQNQDGISYKKSRSFSGEFLNTDAKILSSMTDKMPLLDECINYKNLKD